MSQGQPKELRIRQRRRTLLSGKIIFAGRYAVADCAVRNLSQTGACVELPNTAGIPERFELMIQPTGVEAKCRVVWTRGRRIGVAFERPIKAPGLF